MKGRLKLAMLFLLVFGQIIINRYVTITKFNPDLLYLIVVYFSIRTPITRTLIAGTAVGWLTDAFSGGIVGVYGFSRTLAAFLLYQSYRFFDLNKTVFVFLMIFVSMVISNTAANIFFLLIYGYKLEPAFLLKQPLLTALVGVILATVLKLKDLLDVH